jgi:hypothetical protein
MGEENNPRLKSHYAKSTVLGVSKVLDIIILLYIPQPG